MPPSDQKTRLLPLHDSAPSESAAAAVSPASASADVSVRAKYAWLTLYFALNLALTLYNKAVMGKFPFPYLLTGIHAACGSLGCMFFYMRGAFELTRLSDSESLTILLFSGLYTINIAISNVSLNLVTIPFHQIVRATTPLFTVAIYALVLGQRYPTLTYLSLVPVMLGVGLACYGDIYFTPLGFLLTLLGAFLAALKTVATNRIQTAGLKLSPLELLHRMSPLALAQTLLYAYFSGELSRLQTCADLGRRDAAVLLANGAIAFGLNVISFTANRHTGALTMTVAGNVKQILTIVLSVLFWGLRVTRVNVLGIAVTLAGGAWYAGVELDGKKRKEKEKEKVEGRRAEVEPLREVKAG